MGWSTGELEVDETINLDKPDNNCFVFNESSGLLEPFVDLDSHVNAGDLIGRVHNTKRTGLVPTNYHAKIDGVLAGRNSCGQIVMGDFLAVVAVPM